MEIERKFMLEAFPDLPLLRESVQRQGYLCTKPTLRIRSKESAAGVSYELCFKGEGTLVRQEIELPISKEVFDGLKDLIGKPLIRKDYRAYRLPGGETLECSRVDAGSPTEFCYAEVEFPSVEAARQFVPPPFLGEDVTEKPGSSMSSYWEATRLSHQEED